MPDDPKVHIAKVVRPPQPPIAGLDGFAALGQMVEAARECLKVNQVESTKRAGIRVYKETEVARIKAAEAILKRYFEQVFAERRATFEELFSRLDQALDQGNAKVINVVLRGIVDVACTSPLADLGDLSQIRAALDDPDQVWEL